MLKFFLITPVLLAGADPASIVCRLQQGNQAHAAGRQSVADVTPRRRAALVAAQHPHTVVLTCADSRVPPEYIFNEGLGALFVVRVAGGVADPVTVGSIEYGLEHLHAPLLVVLGHTRCGAVKAAMETPAHGSPGANLESILSRIRPGIPKGAGHKDPWTAAVYGSVEQTMEDLFRISRIIPELNHGGEIGVIGAVYDIETGKAVFSGMLPRAPHQPLVEWKTPTVCYVRATS
jgi:carbonic anhydrase